MKIGVFWEWLGRFNKSWKNVANDLGIHSHSHRYDMKWYAINLDRDHTSFYEGSFDPNS